MRLKRFAVLVMVVGLATLPVLPASADPVTQCFPEVEPPPISQYACVTVTPETQEVYILVNTGDEKHLVSVNGEDPNGVCYSSTSDPEWECIP